MDFREGYEFYYKSNSGIVAADCAHKYIEKINLQIDKLYEDINSFKGFATDPKQLQGDIAEFWQADTFNIKAALNGSKNRAYVDRSNSYSSVDVSTSWGDKYGLKYYSEASASAKAQAKSVFERFKEYQYQGGKDDLLKFLNDRGYSDEMVLNDPIYSGQKRLIPADQLEEARKWLSQKIAKESVIRPEQVKRYEDTLQFLTDKISDGQGNESIELSREEAQKLAQLAKNGDFSLEDYGLTTEDLVNFDMILQEAFKAGMSSAIISTVMKVAPEIIKALSKLIEEGNIDKEDFDKMGFVALSGSAEGFVRGTVTAALVASCEAGLLGNAAKNIDGNAIAMAVVIVMDTMKDAYLVACGKMTQEALAEALVKRTYIATISYVSGTIVQTILSEIPVLGFMLGSFVGSVVGNITYNIGYSRVISFCIDTGFTMFGLVKQDYKLPNEVLEMIGLKIIEPKRLEPKRLEPKRLEPKRLEPKRIDIMFLRRGVIGVNVIGYVL